MGLYFMLDRSPLQAPTLVEKYGICHLSTGEAGYLYPRGGHQGGVTPIDSQVYSHSCDRKFKTLISSFWRFDR